VYKSTQLNNIIAMEYKASHLDGRSLIWKRIFDLVGATLGLLLLSPVFLIIALLIKLDSKGPVIYKSKRVGKNGELFTFYKFRSMYTDMCVGYG
jgi:lipopolysaccharide/colanic/teichoic acid biosynthesis glycosyltransferase